ncbi:hypothetical protein I4U23_016755 [Adineta vaga]|nr:hypothetical protein I4U23_016755 [Adineta vaga]
MLHSCLHSIRTQHPTVHFQVSMGSNVHYLNVYLENQQGQLYSRVYHDPTIQRYTLPYVVGHSKLQHSYSLRSALLRAVCYCSSIEDFQQERIYIELTYLANGYSFFFVESHVQHFFDYYETQYIRYCPDQTNYHIFRRRWFEFFGFQQEHSEKLQELDDKNKVIHFNYFYDYGPRCEFNQDFRDQWSKSFVHHPTLSSDNRKVL